MDVLSGLLGQRAPEFMTAAGFSDSPHFMYSGKKNGHNLTERFNTDVPPAGYTRNGEWFQLYWIGFGGKFIRAYV